MPGAGNPAAWDRYAYGLDNPVKYSDPSGHWVDEGCGGGAECTLPLASGGGGDPTKEYVADVLSGVATLFDEAAVIVAGIDLVAVDPVGLNTLAEGCILGTLVGPEGTPIACGGALGIAYAWDVYVTTAFPTGRIENSLGLLALTATAFSDYLRENTGRVDGSYRIGRDTLVSFRNAAVGFVPEANIDFAVSVSQQQYDERRSRGLQPGGSIELESSQDLLAVLS